MDIIEEYKKRRADRMAVNAFHKRRDERIAAKKQLTEGENDDTMLMDAEWEESKHNRAENGQFASKGGSSSGKAEKGESRERRKGNEGEKRMKQKYYAPSKLYGTKKAVDEYNKIDKSGELAQMYLNRETGDIWTRAYDRNNPKYKNGAIINLINWAEYREEVDEVSESKVQEWAKWACEDYADEKNGKAKRNEDGMMYDAEWEESKHKRAKNGQFSKMSGGGSYKAGNEKSKEKIKSIENNPSKSKQTSGGTAAQSKAQAQAAEAGNAQAGASAGGAEQTKQQKVAAEKARLAEEYKNGNPHAKSGKNEDGSLYKGKRNFGHGYGITTVGERERNDPKNGITIKANTNEKGEWTPEREAMHQQIIDELIPESIPKAEGTPIYTFMGGGPASGKSFVVKNKGAELGVPSKDKAITIDCDNIKGMLPEFSPVDKAKVSGVHEESSALAKRAKEIGMNEGYNVIDDGTGDGGADKMKKKIAQAKKAGMKVNAVYVTTSIENALEQNASRARSVDEDMLISTHKTISEIFPEIAGDFDHVTLWQNDVGSQPVLIAEGGGGKPLQIKNQKLYDDFIAKKGWTRESMKQDEKDERGFTTGLYANDPETIAYYREKEMLTPREDEIIEAVIAGKTIDDLPFTATQADREKWARAEKQYGKGTGRYFSMVNNAD